MSYSDDEEIKIDDIDEGAVDDDLDIDTDLNDPLLEDDLLLDDEEDEGFAGLDGSEY